MLSFSLKLLLLTGIEVAFSFKIGLLLSSYPVIPGIPSTVTSGGAITLALREAQRRFGPLITIHWEDTRCDEALSMMKGYDTAKLNVSVIIGPACEKPMDFVAKLCSVLTPHPVATVTWLPRHQQANDTTISTYWTYADISEAFSIVLKKFAWKNIGILYSKDGLCSNLQDSFNNRFPNQDLDITRNLPLQQFTDEEFTEKLKEVKDHARVVILCLPSEYLFRFLTVADGLGMTAKEFVYIYCRFGPSAGADLAEPSTMSRDDRNRILSPLLQIGLMNMEENEYNDFVSNVTRENASFPNCCQKPDDFARGLYNTIIAVSEKISIAEKTRSSLDLATLRRTSSGHSSDLDQLYKTITLHHHQAGVFELVAHVHGRYDHVRDIVWPTGHLPPDPPECGWDGQQCDKESDVNNAAIVGSCVSITIVLAAVVCLYIFYRKSKYEKELVSMIWKVNIEDIKMRRPRGGTQSSLGDFEGPVRNAQSPPRKKKLMRSDTKGTLGLGSTSSIDKTILFAPVGSYKGTVVAVKTIQNGTFALTREVLRDLKLLREMQHENLNPFIGISLEPGNSYILMKYCSKGSLQDVLENEDIKLDSMFQMSFLMDLARGLDIIHRSPIKSHGNLKSSNCVIDSRWVLKVTDYGALVAPAEEEHQKDTEENQDYFAHLLWTAPELLRLQKRPRKGTQKGDVYSFAIIMQEILLRCPPFYFNNAPSNQYIINRLRDQEDPPYRPYIPETTGISEKLKTLMTMCWHRSPEFRHDAHGILKTLIDINGRRKMNIMDHMIQMLEAYSNNLEELVADRTELLAQEKQKTDRLLYQMLPPSVAEQLKRGEHVVPETYSEASLFFSDIVGFTSISGDSTPLQVIDLLNDLYTTFDEIIGMHDVYKVETIGDAYMVASGIPRRNGRRHAGEIANMALDLLSAVTKFRIRHMPGAKLQLRIGLHTGPCAAGVVGLTMPRYCLFGDTINMASRMESTGKAFHIHISNDMADALNYLKWGFQLLERGIIEVKGKGLQKTYWLVGKNGYAKELPEEMQKLSKKLDEAEASGRPMSPTDTHISTGSNHDSPSMYGNIFRRASFAVRFIRKLSHSSRENSPNNSRLSVKDMDYCGEQTLNIPVSANGLTPPMLQDSSRTGGTETYEYADGDGSSTSGKRKKKKKKSKSFRKEKNLDHSHLTDDHKSPTFALDIPTIQITPQIT